MIIHGDSLEILKTLDSDSVDAVVTDPPYGLSFMGKKWDYDVPSVLLWREVFRVIKPGGHILSFGGTRTYHRLVVAIEDAGFQIRDQVQWIYGSGFPKSLDVSKAIDKAAGAEREIIGKYNRPDGSNHRTAPRIGVVNTATPSIAGTPQESDLTAPATPDAIKWQGFGTALKPANEPIVLARKPLSEKTVAKNVLKWGTGSLNIDGSRIAYQGDYRSPARADGKVNSGGGFGAGVTDEKFDNAAREAQGRWPANVLLGCDCEVRLSGANEKTYLATDQETQSICHYPDCAVKMLDEQSGDRKGFSGGGTKGAGYRTEYVNGEKKNKTLPAQTFNDSGGASRFFYVAKSSKRERNAGLEGMPERECTAKQQNSGGRMENGVVTNERPSEPKSANHHPTVKPIKLMEYLCKLITPPGGVILDPFAGSGSTLVAAKRLGFEFIGIEKELEYCEIARRRVANE